MEKKKPTVKTHFGHFTLFEKNLSESCKTIVQNIILKKKNSKVVKKLFEILFLKNYLEVVKQLSEILFFEKKKVKQLFEILFFGKKCKIVWKLSNNFRIIFWKKDKIIEKKLSESCQIIVRNIIFWKKKLPEICQKNCWKYMITMIVGVQ